MSDWETYDQLQQLTHAHAATQQRVERLERRVEALTNAAAQLAEQGGRLSGLMQVLTAKVLEVLESQKGRNDVPTQ